MKKFDTTVKLLKHKVLTEVARMAFKDRLLGNFLDIPKKIIPGEKAVHRCCVYKERAILSERVKIAMGGNRENPNIIEVIETACDGCPADGYNVTNICRGCLSHNCVESCPKKCISINSEHISQIDKKKCINCGLCAKACPYNAIVNAVPPCQKACKIDAIERNEDGIAVIDNEKCVSCGFCITGCPFGAINDKSFILNVIDMLMNKQEKIYAIYAPSIAGQFEYATFGQLISGIKKLGFDKVMEVALGADMVAYKEAGELKEKKFLTSSCCPSFKRFVEIFHPDMAKHVSHNLSPMGEIARSIKEKDKNAKVVFIGPCTSKKAEYQRPEVADYVDSVLTYEELQALFESLDIEIEKLPEAEFNDASYFGRVFARSGGVTEAVKQGVKERNLDFEVRPLVCSGLEDCHKAMLKLKNATDGSLENFVEGMACPGGCVGGAGNLHYGPKNKVFVEQYAQKAGKNMTEKIEAQTK